MPRSSVASSAAYERRKCVSRRLKILPGMISSCRSIAAGDKLARRAPGRFRKGIKRAARPHQLVSPRTSRPRSVALPPIGVDVRLHVDVERHGARPLHRLRRADERVLLQLASWPESFARAVREPNRQPVIP